MRLLFFIVVTFCMLGCGDSGGFGPGAADFSAPLPHGYFIYRSSAHQVKVAPRSWDASTPIIPSEIVELDHDDTFVIAKQQHLRRRSPNNPSDTYEEPDPGMFSYWILKLSVPKVWGPLTFADFEAKRTELGVPRTLKLHDVYDYKP